MWLYLNFKQRSKKSCDTNSKSCHFQTFQLRIWWKRNFHSESNQRKYWYVNWIIGIFPGKKAGESSKKSILFQKSEKLVSEILRKYSQQGKNNLKVIFQCQFHSKMYNWVQVFYQTSKQYLSKGNSISNQSWSLEINVFPTKIWIFIFIFCWKENELLLDSKKFGKYFYGKPIRKINFDFMLFLKLSCLMNF